MQVHLPNTLAKYTKAFMALRAQAFVALLTDCRPLMNGRGIPRNQMRKQTNCSIIHGNRFLNTSLSGHIITHYLVV